MLFVVIIARLCHQTQGVAESKVVNGNLLTYVMTERNVLSSINHPFIVSLHYAFQTTTHLVLVLQYCPCGQPTGAHRARRYDVGSFCISVCARVWRNFLAVSCARGAARAVRGLCLVCGGGVRVGVESKQVVWLLVKRTREHYDMNKERWDTLDLIAGRSQVLLLLFYLVFFGFRFFCSLNSCVLVFCGESKDCGCFGG